MHTILYCTHRKFMSLVETSRKQFALYLRWNSHCITGQNAVVYRTNLSIRIIINCDICNNINLNRICEDMLNSHDPK